MRPELARVQLITSTDLLITVVVIVVVVVVMTARLSGRETWRVWSHLHNNRRPALQVAHSDTTTIRDCFASAVRRSWPWSPCSADTYVLRYCRYITASFAANLSPKGYVHTYTTGRPIRLVVRSDQRRSNHDASCAKYIGFTDLHRRCLGRCQRASRSVLLIDSAGP